MDIDQAVELQKACFPDPFPQELLWQEAHLRRHLELFPQGQFAAVEESWKLIGTASDTRLSEERWMAHGNWEDTVGGPYLETFDALGNTLYGLDISVHPAWRGRGVARALYERRFQLVRECGLARYATACRIPDYRLHADTVSPESYVRLVAKGALTDRTLTPLLKMGLLLRGVQKEHMEDWESRNSAAVLEWLP